VKILNFGSLNIDMVYSVAHFVRAGETLSSGRLEKFCGGKGLNQSIALAKAGAEVYHAGCIGPDGAMLTEALAANSVNTQFVQAVDTPCGHAVIQVDTSGQNCILLFGGANQCVTEVFAEKVFSYFSQGDILLLQNEINGLDFIMHLGREKGMRIALNPSPIGDNLKSLPLEYVNWFILNEHEGRELSGKSNPPDILDTLVKKYPDGEFVLTLGKAGVLYDNRQTRVGHGVYDVPVVDTTAAGDTFTGFFLQGVSAEQTPKEILEIASIASSLAVSKKGASSSIPSMSDVLAARTQHKAAGVPAQCCAPIIDKRFDD